MWVLRIYRRGTEIKEKFYDRFIYSVCINKSVIEMVRLQGDISELNFGRRNPATNLEGYK